MNSKRMLFVIVGVSFACLSGYTDLFPWNFLFGMVGGGMIGHATYDYAKGR